MAASAFPASQRARGSAIRAWLPFLLVVAAYVFLATREIQLPGIYMDAVNPDYLVTRILEPHARPFVAWAAPGNDLQQRYPVLIGLHHGSAQFWLGLPFFAIFGMTVEGLRLTHMMFGLGVLAACYCFLLRCGVGRVLAAGACLALALDPAFVFAFRTQSYITMAPVALVMLALVALIRARDADRDDGARWLFAAGLLLGLACWGYFIYAFFLPALFVAVWAWRWPTRPGGVRRAGVFAAGIALGASFYVLGYALVANALGGVSAAWAHLESVQPGHSIVGDAATLRERVDHLVDVLDMVLTDGWHRALMFGEDTRSSAERAKAVALLMFPVVGLLAAERFRVATWAMRLIVALIATFILVSLLFGTRLAGHHYMPLVPLLYISAALTIDALLARFGSRSARILAIGGGLVIVLMNIAAEAREFDSLRRTGGVATFSDAINRFGMELATGDADRVLMLPDWGLLMPVVFLTHARYETHFDVDDALMRRALCDNRDVLVGLITESRRLRFESMRERLGWTAPSIARYRQRDGDVVFEVATFRGNREGPGCVK